MNADTGRTYMLPDVGQKVGEPLTQEMTALMLKSAAAADLEQTRRDVAAAIEDLERGEPIVSVAGEVAQAQEVGRRELERRRRRTRARRS